MICPERGQGGWRCDVSTVLLAEHLKQQHRGMAPLLFLEVPGSCSPFPPGAPRPHPADERQPEHPQQLCSSTIQKKKAHGSSNANHLTA